MNMALELERVLNQNIVLLLSLPGTKPGISTLQVMTFMCDISSALIAALDFVANYSLVGTIDISYINVLTCKVGVPSFFFGKGV